MKGEIPVFKKCCFCVPLRYGLLTWGYFKMTADAILASIMSYVLINILVMIRIHEKDHYISQAYTELIVSIIAIIIFFADFVVAIVFIVGGHKKNVKLIRIFYVVSIGMWVITFLLTAIQVVTALQNLIDYSLHYWARFVMPFSFFFAVILAVQSYFLMLLRSEIIKLRNNGEFRFVNNAAEPECTMTCEVKVVGEETV